MEPADFEPDQLSTYLTRLKNKEKQHLNKRLVQYYMRTMSWTVSAEVSVPDSSRA